MSLQSQAPAKPSLPGSPGRGRSAQTRATIEARLLGKICARIAAGDGTGHLERYKPWLPLTRRNSSPDSNQLATWLPPLGRSLHFFSRGEYRAALLLLWLGVEDLREQYPIWPMPHPHPLDGASGAPCNLPWSRGLLAIASAAKIDHGTEVGSRIPYVATIDLLATVRTAGRLCVVAFSCKPISEHTTSFNWRMQERLELERRYANELPCPYFLISSSLVPATMAANLETWLADANLHSSDLIGKVEMFTAYVGAHRNGAAREAVAGAANVCGITQEDGWRLLRHCAWHQIIDLNPTRKILATYPLPPGGRILRQELSAKLLGTDGYGS